MTALTEHQKTMLSVWQQHGYAEFVLKDPHAAIATMNAEPYILCSPLGQLFFGRDAVFSFYKNDFLSKIPSVVELEPTSRIIGENHIADEFIFRFKHDCEMPWEVPGVPPTGRMVEIVKQVIVGFDGDKIAYEHLMWDHGSVLHQLGLNPHPAAAIGASGPELLRKVMALKPDHAKGGHA